MQKEVALLDAAIFACLLCWAQADHFTIDERTRLWHDNLKHTVQDYYNRAWYRRKVSEAAAEAGASRKLGPFVAGGDFYGADYNPNKVKNASYIDLPRIYASQPPPSTLFVM